jgi:two-component sensor histidine kinase
MHPDDRHLLATYHALAATQDAFAAEYRIFRHGEIRWLAGFGRVLERGRNREPRLMINVVTDVTEQKAAEEHLRFLLRELSHRSNNLLTVVQAVAGQTLRQWTEPKEFQKRFFDRLCGLAASTSLIANGQARGASLRPLIERQLEPFIDLRSAQIELDGPEIELTADAAQAVGLALHELATNALKHGALSVPHGTVEIAWDADAEHFELSWRERNGPFVHPPEREGFGTTVMTQMVSQSVNGTATLTFPPEGLCWRLEASIAGVTP